MAVALKSQKVSEASLEAIKEVLRKIMMKVGVRSQNLPNELEKLVLYEHIVENYGGHRLDEIRLAFDLAIRGSLSDEDGVVLDANCYENFSCLYVSKVMNGYRKWARNEFKYIPSVETPKQKIFTEDELADSAREDVEVHYQMFLRGYEIKNEILHLPILRTDKLIKDNETVIDFFERKKAAGFNHLYQRV